ncbi:zf-HC2 domain-containing protein [uncultured Corynebacterium sp.]|uniref:zf-HC2 domain-containing protein n=1 Tax=uncultured Corynebacterium sp. TaxID=159447 RepID=UPI0025E4BD6C|nr:zf-HC2 domain-containing protein [uncultured Corynebacterium sp.]
MKCEDVRAALSARLDGEPSGADDDVVDAHLDACDECRAWFEKAVALNRSLLMGPAREPGEPGKPSSRTGAAGAPGAPGAPGMPAAADMDALSERILSTVEPERRRRERTWLFVTGSARVLLVLLGVFHLLWGIELLLGTGGAMSQAALDAGGANGAGAGADDAGAGAEAAAAAAALDELIAPSVDAAAIRMAFAVGMFWAVWRPRAAMGMTPVYGAAAMFSIGFATRDLVLGNLGVTDVAGLALMAVSAIALGLVWLGGYTPTAMAQAWRAASGRPVRGLPGGLD